MVESSSNLFIPYQEYLNYINTQGQPQQGVNMTTLDDQYPEVSVPENFLSKRTFFQKKLNLPMDSLDDIRLRLGKTIIFIGGEPYYVKDAYKEGRTWLLLRNSDNKDCRVSFNHPSIELRTPEAQYIHHAGSPYFYYRIPAREQKQGLSVSNCRLKQVGLEFYDNTGIQDITDFMNAFKNDETLFWNETYESLITTTIISKLRLSKRVAVFSQDIMRKGNPIITLVEYKGRFLGELKEDTVLLDKEDYHKPWIRSDLAQVNLRLKQTQ